MKSIKCFLFAILPLSLFATVSFPGYGFSIKSLESDGPLSENAAPVVMTLPAKYGFSSNVNVMIQIYAGTIDAYVELSRGQYKALAFLF